MLYLASQKTGQWSQFLLNTCVQSLVRQPFALTVLHLLKVPILSVLLHSKQTYGRQIFHAQKMMWWLLTNYETHHLKRSLTSE
jgi:hypothetical protein